MEEAADEENVTNKFFCHMCNSEINRVLEDYSCPRCHEGFTEELDFTLTSSDEPSDDHSDDEMDESSASDVANQYSEILFQIDAGSDMQRNQDPRSQDSSQIDDTSVNGGWRRVRSSSYRSFRPSVLALIISLISSIRARTQSNTGHGRNTRTETIVPVMQLVEDIFSLHGMDQFRGRNDSPAPIQHVIEDFMMNITSFGWSPIGPGGRGNNPVFFLGNPGDYAWGREGLDAIVTQLLNQMDVTGPPPLDKQKIREIPVTVIEQEQVDSNLKCSVCWEDFKIGESVRKLKCEHLYHEACIDPWLELHGTCPVCRKSLLGDQDEKQPLNSGNGTPRAADGIPDLATILRAASSRASSSASSSSASSTSTSNMNPSSERPQPPPPSDSQMDFD